MKVRRCALFIVGQHRAPFFASHWTQLLLPLVPDYSDEKGLTRYRQIQYARMPLMAYLAMDDARKLTRADFVRLGLVRNRPRDAGAMC